jgi:hypothetical protein
MLFVDRVAMHQLIGAFRSFGRRTWSIQPSYRLSLNPIIAYQSPVRASGIEVDHASSEPMVA